MLPSSIHFWSVNVVRTRLFPAQMPFRAHRFSDSPQSFVEDKTCHHYHFGFLITAISPRRFHVRAKYKFKQPLVSTGINALFPVSSKIHP